MEGWIELRSVALWSAIEKLFEVTQACIYLVLQRLGTFNPIKKVVQHCTNFKRKATPSENRIEQAGLGPSYTIR